MSRTKKNALFPKSQTKPPESFVPLSTANQYILLSLASHERHGYAIMQEVEEASEGTVKLGPGTLYRSIHELLENGLIEELAKRPADNDDQRRRYYRLTSLGQQVLACESRRLAGLLAMARSMKVLPKGST